jgi:hypothetical protein
MPILNATWYWVFKMPADDAFVPHCICAIELVTASVFPNQNATNIETLTQSIMLGGSQGGPEARYVIAAYQQTRLPASKSSTNQHPNPFIILGGSQGGPEARNVIKSLKVL